MKPIFLVIAIFFVALFPMACLKTYSVSPLPAPASPTPTRTSTLTSLPTSTHTASPTASPTATCSYINGGQVTTFAGQVGVTGSTNATGTAASFYDPMGGVEDASGNFYVAEFLNQLIRKITPGGIVTTFAGSGVQGQVDGVGTAAEFNYPTCVAIDSSGNFYVTDNGSSLIRKITPGGAVTTLAGSAVGYGYADGTGSAAKFYGPQGIAVDSAGNLYVGDGGNNCIRKITPGGVVSTFAGYLPAGHADGQGTFASFWLPMGVAIDAAGNLYVADSSNCLIRKITPSGLVSTLAGTAGVVGSANGTGPAASFNYPRGIAVDSCGDIYVAEENNHMIRKITQGGVVTTLAGSGTAGFANGTGTAASFNFPDGVWTDTAGNVYVGDTLNQVIRKIQ